jgi:hypothetical protein
LLFSDKLSKENNRPIGENSPILVTLNESEHRQKVFSQLPDETAKDFQKVVAL